MIPLSTTVAVELAIENLLKISDTPTPDTTPSPPPLITPSHSTESYPASQIGWDDSMWDQRSSPWQYATSRKGYNRVRQTEVPPAATPTSALPTTGQYGTDAKYTPASSSTPQLYPTHSSNDTHYYPGYSTIQASGSDHPHWPAPAQSQPTPPSPRAQLGNSARKWTTDSERRTTGGGIETSPGKVVRAEETVRTERGVDLRVQPVKRHGGGWDAAPVLTLYILRGLPGSGKSRLAR